MEENAGVKDVVPGCTLRTIDDSLWYCIGTWAPRRLQHVVPCFLGYVRAGDRFTAGGKRLVVDDRQWRKVFGQDIRVFRDVYLPAVNGFIAPLQLGRIVFLEREHIVEVRNPKDFVRPFVSAVRPEGDLLLELCGHFGLAIDDVGIGGSSLMFRSPRRRQDIDLCIYGREKSREVFRSVFEGRESGLFSDEWRGKFYLPFRYKGVWFDPQFSTAPGETDDLEGAEIEVLGREQDVDLEITDVGEAIFLPALYGTSAGRRLISFRPGQRGFFRQGQTVRFASLSVVEIRRPNQQPEVLYAVLDDEWGTVLE